MNRYDVKAILESNTLPIGGGAAKRLKEAQAIESSRKREEMLALSSTFQYGNSSASSSPYPLLHQQSLIDQNPQPNLLSLQNHEIPQYTASHHHHQDPASLIHQNYNNIQTQLQLHQQSTASYLHLQQGHNNHHQYYNSYIQNHPALLQGLMEMGSSSSLVHDNNGSSSGSYSGGGGGYLSNNGVVGGVNGMSNSNSTSHAEEQLGIVKIDYDQDMPSGNYAGWSGGSTDPNTGHVFTMWND